MGIEVNTWLFDISKAIAEIDSFFLDTPKHFSSYKKDTRTRRAVERNIGIIGEALNRILIIDSNIPITNARKIVDTRNRIIHGYDSVSDEIIWSFVINYLPLLQSEIQANLNT